MLDDETRASEIEDESPEDYAARKGIVITDNSGQRRKVNVANGDDLTKSELQDAVDQALDILQGAYVPESDRETLAQACGDAISVLEGGDLDEDDDGDDTDHDGQ